MTDIRAASFVSSGVKRQQGWQLLEDIVPGFLSNFGIVETTEKHELLHAEPWKAGGHAVYGQHDDLHVTPGEIDGTSGEAGGVRRERLCSVNTVGPGTTNTSVERES